MADRPAVLAHRGASGHAPENTIAAFELARKLGADGVELDVRRTADDVLVVNHDPEVEGLGLVRDRSYAELRDSAPDLPDLESVLDVLEGMTVNLEIKCLPWEPDADPERVVVKAVTDLVRGRAIADRALISSFDLEAVNAVRALDPGVRTAWITYGRSLGSALELVSGLGHVFLHPDRATMLEATDEHLALVASEGLELNVWTVNDISDIERIAAMGVAGIITDYPDRVLEHIEQLALPAQGSTSVSASDS